MSTTNDETAWLRGIGLRVKIARVTRGESQEELGERAGVTRSLVGSVERSDHAAAVTTYARLAKAAGIPLGDLLDGAP